MLGRYLAISAAIHAAALGVLSIGTGAVQIHFDVAGGISSLAVSVRHADQKQQKLERRKLILHRDINIIISSGGAFGIEKNNREQKKASGPSMRKMIGALSDRARKNSLNNPPEYPYIARRMRWQGSVLLSIQVMPSGRSGEVNVVKGSGSAVLDDAAVKAAAGWIFFKTGEMKLMSPVKIRQEIIFSIR